MATHHWPIPLQTILWGLLLAAAAVLFWRGCIKVFGPILWYDMVRTARRRQFVAARCAFALSLSIGLLLIWAGATLKKDPISGDRFFAPTLPVSELAELNFHFFCTVMGLQLLAALVLTPAYTGATIAQEKDRHTLEFLLATDLSSREIVLSLLVSRLANLVMIFLTGLGILAPLQFLGGIDPELLLAGYAALGLTVLSLASLGILNSVHTRRPHEGITRTYMTAGGYLAFATAAKMLLSVLPRYFPSTAAWTWLQEVVRWLNAGNIVAVVFDLKKGVSGGASLNALLPGVLGPYAWFHLLAAAGCTSLAVFQLRRVALKQITGPERQAASLPGSFRVGIGNWPMLWKEIVAERGRRRGLFARLGIGLLVTASFLPAAGIFYFHCWPQVPFVDWDNLIDKINHWVKHTGNIVACLMLLVVTIRAAGSISGERDRQTFDTLLTTPLDSTGILFAKWLGSLLSLRWAWCWLGTVWLTAYLLGGLDAAAITRLLLAWLAFASFQGVLGLWFSFACRSTQRATLWALLATSLLWGGHWVVWLACRPLFNWERHSYRMVEAFQKYGLTPPTTFTRLTRLANAFVADESSIHVWTGIVLWSLAGVALWCWTSYRFRKAVCRSSVLRPERPDPSQSHDPVIPQLLEFRLQAVGERLSRWPRPLPDSLTPTTEPKADRSHHE